MTAKITDADRAAAHEALQALGYGGACDLLVPPGRHVKMCAVIAQAIADAREEGVDNGRRDSFLAAEQGMKDAEAAGYEPTEVPRFMLDAISARLGAK